MTKPFLKWAGGKRWLTSRYPFLFNHSFERYVEPFLGSGAVFFHLAPPKSLLSDVNAELMNLYERIRADHSRVEQLLSAHARVHSDDYYYHVRSQKLRSPSARAARFLYLNRTCWNGLYRENRQGEFNVPRGTKNTVLFEDDDFEGIAKLLSAATLESSDFESIVRQARYGDFVFIDPPYTVRHNSNGFIKYNEKMFSWADQERLASTLRETRHCGATYLVTNAYHQSVVDLYADFATIVPASRASVLSGRKEHRGPTKEALILIGEKWSDILEAMQRSTKNSQWSSEMMLFKPS